MDNIIRTENLWFSYTEDGNDIPVLKNINLTVKKGEFLSILGHNGSGKSTLAKHFNTILLPTQGKVYIKDMDTSDESLSYIIRQTVGLVFQNPDNQIVSSIVEEDVAFAPENLGLPSQEIRKRVDYALKAVDMYEYKDHGPHLLSGGQKQRIAIAGIIAMKPECIVLDEPTAMLDPSGRDEVMKVIKRLNREEGITVILITHHMDEAALADRIVVMNEGEILIDGTPHYVFQNAGLLKSIGLSVPQSTELMFLLREAGIRVPLAVLTIDECVDVLSELLKNSSKTQ